MTSTTTTPSNKSLGSYQKFDPSLGLDGIFELDLILLSPTEKNWVELEMVIML